MAKTPFHQTAVGYVILGVAITVAGGVLQHWLTEPGKQSTAPAPPASEVATQKQRESAEPSKPEPQRQATPSPAPVSLPVPQHSVVPSESGPSSAPTVTGEGSRPLTALSTREASSKPAPSPSNLVTNGDFSQSWDVGWNKEVEDPTQGSFVVERDNGMLHVVLNGQNTGQVWQVVTLPVRSLEGLMFEAGVRLIPKRQGMLGLAPPVETALVLQFQDQRSNNQGQIWFTQFATTGLEGSGLAGVPDTLHGTGQRCQIPLKEGFNRVAVNLSQKAKDCLARPISDAAAVMIVCLMRTNNPQSAAEAFLDHVRMYYLNAPPQSSTASQKDLAQPHVQPPSTERFITIRLFWRDAAAGSSVMIDGHPPEYVASTDLSATVRLPNGLVTHRVELVKHERVVCQKDFPHIDNLEVLPCVP